MKQREGVKRHRLNANLVFYLKDELSFFYLTLFLLAHIRHTHTHTNKKVTHKQSKLPIKLANLGRVAVGGFDADRR